MGILSLQNVFTKNGRVFVALQIASCPSSCRELLSLLSLYTCVFNEENVCVPKFMCTCACRHKIVLADNM